MIRNQSHMPQSAVMPEYYQQMQLSPNQSNLGSLAENAQPAVPSYQCCVDISQMHHFPYMHDFHHMHDIHPMHDSHHMHHYHPMMNDFHPMMHEMWDDHMSYDHHHHHHHHHHHDDDGWGLETLDYHHAWLHPMMHMDPMMMHPMMHMQHHPHHLCFPCQLTGELQKKAEVEKP